VAPCRGLKSAPVIDLRRPWYYSHCMVSDGIPTEPLLVASNVSKTFGGEFALRNVRLSVARGTVHGLVGTNGAGKSTLVGVLSGTVRPDSGTVMLDGTELPFGSPHASKEAGFATVFQHGALVESMSIAENVTLGATPIRHGIVAADKCRAIAEEAMSLVGLSLDPRTEAGKLSLGERRLLDIGRALQARAKLVILDEPTSALSRPEAARLFFEVRRAVAQGVSFIYVSHFLEEVLEVCDRVTVMRDGRDVTQLEAREATLSSLVQHMLGAAASSRVSTARPTGAPRFIATDLQSANGRLHDGSFAVQRGRVVGVTGLQGSGVEELGRIIGGLEQAVAGTVKVDGHEFVPRSPSEAKRFGIGYLPGDRLREGILAEASLTENFALGLLDRFSKHGNVKRSALVRASRSRFDSLRLVRRDDNMPAGQLSGGNQQKVVLGRLLESDPRVLILDSPTRGVDVGVKVQIATIIDGLAHAGTAIVWLSDDLEELCDVCDEILVLTDGSFTAHIDAAHAYPQDVLTAMQESGVG